MKREERTSDRRQFLTTTAALSAGAALSRNQGAQAAPEPPASDRVVVDTHMHVWADDTDRYPWRHPYQPDFAEVPHSGTVEMLIDDMDRNDCAFCVLVQVIYHGWDNTYVADCVKRFPERLRAHGLIDPTDPKVADQLEFWTKEHGLHGMRFSPIYYRDGRHGGDGWMTSDSFHALWHAAERLGSVLNFFIAPTQLPKLEAMVKQYDDVPVIIDHMSQIDLGQPDPEPDFQRLLRMARYPRVYVKVSELSSVSKSKAYPFADAYPYVERLYAAFGGDRLLFGTGYPGSARAAYQRPTLAAEIALVAKHMPFFDDSDRAKLLGENAVKLWGFW